MADNTHLRRKKVGAHASTSSPDFKLPSSAPMVFIVAKLEKLAPHPLMAAGHRLFSLVCFGELTAFISAVVNT